MAEALGDFPSEPEQDGLEAAALREAAFALTRDAYHPLRTGAMSAEDAAEIVIRAYLQATGPREEKPDSAHVREAGG